MNMPIFAPPGPGPWEPDGAHFPKPIPAFGRDSVIEGFKRGFKEGTANYGLLLSHFEIKIVNGFWYQQPAPFGAPPGAMGPPPKAILWLLTRLHPGMRARIRASAEAFTTKRWRDDLKYWDEVDKPAAVAKHQKLLAEDPAAMDDPALLAHLRRCEAHVGDMVYLHHKYTMPCCIPVGDFIAHVAAWTGKDAGDIVALLRGSSKISLGVSTEELAAIAAAVRGDPGADELLRSGDGAQGTLDALQAREGSVGEATRAFVEQVRHRALNYDVGERSCGEMPDMLVKAIRAAVDGRFTAARDDVAERLKALRDAVPEEHRAQFDELLGEARAINRLRDERGMYADCLAIGISRRALLELGRRLLDRGALKEVEGAVDMVVDEAEALLTGKAGPSADEVHERTTWRKTKTVADIPPFLRAKPAPPPDDSVLPEAAKRAGRAVGGVMGNLFGETTKTSTEKVVRGISVNAGVYEGVARRVDGASDFHRIEQGDVLVTRSTAPYFNVVLPMLGAIVTDRGGQLSHAAIVAREYGIPGVVGTKEATRLIPDGARVRVDGGSGEVTVLS